MDGRSSRGLDLGEMFSSLFGESCGGHNSGARRRPSSDENILAIDPSDMGEYPQWLRDSVSAGHDGYKGKKGAFHMLDDLKHRLAVENNQHIMRLLQDALLRLDGLREQLTEQKNVYESALKELKKNLRNERQLVQVKSQALNRRGEVVQDLRKKNGDLVAERDELVSKLVVIEALIKQIDPAAKKPILTEQLKKLAAQASVGTSEESSQLETSTEASIGEKPAQ